MNHWQCPAQLTQLCLVGGAIGPTQQGHELMGAKAVGEQRRPHRRPEPQLWRGATAEPKIHFRQGGCRSGRSSRNRWIQATNRASDQRGGLGSARKWPYVHKNDHLEDQQRRAGNRTGMGGKICNGEPWGERASAGPIVSEG